MDWTLTWAVVAGLASVGALWMAITEARRRSQAVGPVVWRLDALGTSASEPDVYLWEITNGGSQTGMIMNLCFVNCSPVDDVDHPVRLTYPSGRSCDILVQSDDVENAWVLVSYVPPHDRRYTVVTWIAPQPGDELGAEQGREVEETFRRTRALSHVGGRRTGTGPVGPGGSRVAALSNLKDREARATQQERVYSIAASAGDRAHWVGGGWLFGRPRGASLVADDDMTDYLGIANYHPVFHYGVNDILDAHRTKLAALVGKRLDRSWLLWDLDDDSWFADAPVLLDFEGTVAQIQHCKLADLSITWNSIDPTAPVRFFRPLPDFPLGMEWKGEALDELNRLHGQRLRDIHLLTWASRDFAYGMTAVHFTFDDGQLTIYNALDENGMAFVAPESDYEWHTVA